MLKKRGQIWVETVLYTLIGLAVIGILLGVSKPKIDQIKDKAIIEQTIESMNRIDSKIFEVQRAPGNVRVIEIKISKGRLIITPGTDTISWEIDSKYKYSQVGSVVDIGNLKVLTSGEGDDHKVTLTSSYSVDLTYNGKDQLKEFTGAPSPYKVRIENMGSSGGNLNIDLGVE